MKRPVGFLAQGAAIRVSASAAFGSGDRLREGTHRGRNPSKNFSLDLQINDAMITTTWHRFLDFDLRLVNKEINQPIKKKKRKKDVPVRLPEGTTVCYRRTAAFHCSCGATWPPTR